MSTHTVESEIYRLNRILLFIATTILTPSAIADKDSTFQLLIEGTTCDAIYDEMLKINTLECNYTIGDKLRIRGHGIGGPFPGYSFLKSDSANSHHARFSTMHGCIGVFKSDDLGDMAFINPASGFIYPDSPSCGADEQRKK